MHRKQYLHKDNSHHIKLMDEKLVKIGKTSSSKTKHANKIALNRIFRD